ncbi:unnamed protein product [Rangifer tarandus platyrhynchus]|uniref:Basic proline-rich protein-like n=1 Tax=Rangifer tarandus platyrhynchus TaxID=3082113 RepID=A0ABN8YVK7_RANTA|nr:unnamed protein product [Rangifer tarandus platyrhynchus]
MRARSGLRGDGEPGRPRVWAPRRVKGLGPQWRPRRLARDGEGRKSRRRGLSETLWRHRGSRARRTLRGHCPSAAGPAHCRHRPRPRPRPAHRAFLCGPPGAGGPAPRHRPAYRAFHCGASRSRMPRPSSSPAHRAFLCGAPGAGGPAQLWTGPLPPLRRVLWPGPAPILCPGTRPTELHQTGGQVGSPQSQPGLLKGPAASAALASPARESPPPRSLPRRLSFSSSHPSSRGPRFPRSEGDFGLEGLGTRASAHPPPPSPAWRGLDRPSPDEAALAPARHPRSGPRRAPPPLAPASGPEIGLGYAEPAGPRAQRLRSSLEAQRRHVRPHPGTRSSAGVTSDPSALLQPVPVGQDLTLERPRVKDEMKGYRGCVPHPQVDGQGAACGPSFRGTRNGNRHSTRCAQRSRPDNQAGGLLRAARQPQTGSDGKSGRDPGAPPRDGQTDSSPGSGAPRIQQWTPACPPAHPFCWDTGAAAGTPVPGDGLGGQTSLWSGHGAGVPCPALPGPHQRAKHKAPLRQADNQPFRSQGSRAAFPAPLFLPSSCE